MATLNNRISDEMIAHSLFISRYSKNVATRMVNVLDQMDSILSEKLFTAISDLKDIQEETFTTRRLESFLVYVKAINQQAVSSLMTALDSEIQAFCSHESSWQYNLFDSLLVDAVKRRYPLAGMTQEQVYAAAMSQPFQGRLLREWVSTIEDDRMDRLSNTVRYGYLEGETTEQIIRRVRGTKAKNYKDGILEQGRHNTTAIVRSAIGHVSAVTRQKFSENNADIVKGKIWRSTLDNKTTSQCRIRDSRKYTLDGKPIGHKIPYLRGPGRIHFCCRSTETLITKSWRELGIDIDEMDEGTRASMDGQVPEETTYSEWIQRQPFSRQVQILGITRARLMRDGGMAYDTFYTDKGEWLTLEQLRDIDAEAFEEAEL